ncbi:hypothetical protein BGW39_004016 [Mortierella sp. 14UC]|nr:hypothetical protein BGW39_004016 [Mortierella sp. 14UC]
MRPWGGCRAPDPVIIVNRGLHKRALPLLPVDPASTSPTIEAPASPIVDLSSPSSTSSSPATTTTGTGAATKNTTLIMTSAILGSLLLLIALLLFYVCMKRRHASSSASRRRIGQMQSDLMPNGGYEEEKSEKYYYKHQHQYHQHYQPQMDTTSSASTLVSPPPSYAHHRTRSAPIAFAFAKDGRRHSDTTNNASSTALTSPTIGVRGYGQMGRIRRDSLGMGGGGQFQQISLVAEEAEEEDVSFRRSFSSNDGGGGYGFGERVVGFAASTVSSRNRSKTVAFPTPVVSALHRSVSLSTHAHTHTHSQGSDYYSNNPYRHYNSRSGAAAAPHDIDSNDDDDEPPLYPHDTDANGRHHQLRFAEGENPHVSHNHPSSTFLQQQQQQPYPYLQHHTSTPTPSTPSNRYSVNMGHHHHPHRGSITSAAMEFDPSRFSTMSVMFDAKRLFQRSSYPVSSSNPAIAPGAAFQGGLGHPRPPTGPPDSDDSDDDTVSTSSSDGFDDLPPHQLSQHFEFHNPYAVSTTTTTGRDDKQDLNGDRCDDNADDDEGEGNDEGEAIVEGLGVRRQHGYPVYGQTISPLSLPPMPPQISSEWPPQDSH